MHFRSEHLPLQGTTQTLKKEYTKIYQNLSKSIKIYQYLSKSIKIYKHIPKYTKNEPCTPMEEPRSPRPGGYCVPECPQTH